MYDNQNFIKSNVGLNLCKFFQHRGWCAYGENCRFSHQMPSRNQNQAGPESENRRFRYRPQCFSSRPVIFHRTPAFNNPIRDRSNLNLTNSRPQSSNSFNKFFVSIDEANSDKLNQLRISEIESLKKFYPNFKEISPKLDKSSETLADDLATCQNNPSTFLIIFTPSDPDWPFDVKKLEFCFTFPSNYPAQILEVHLSEESDHNYLPDTLIFHINSEIKQHLQSIFDENKNRLNRYSLILRPFLKWLDKNLCEFFVSGLKKVKLNLQAKSAGITFVPVVEKVPENDKKDKLDQEKVINSVENLHIDAKENDFETTRNENFDEIDENFDETDENFSQTDQNFSQIDENLRESDENSPKISEKLDNFSLISINPSNAIVVKLRNLELSQNVATVTPKKLNFSVSCSRCKLKFEWTWCKGANSKQILDAECKKCCLKHVLKVQPNLAHLNSDTLCLIELENLVISDLIPLSSEFIVNCLNCNTNVTISNIKWGIISFVTCRQCNSKLDNLFHGVDFVQKSDSAYPLAPCKGATEGQRSKQKDGFNIKKGEPLPANGACKHYKKSFRWFRFPCCGKLYPCDVCHEENESHEMKFANRIICGFCSKEQPYSGNKPCTSCENYVTKVYSAHWEGGKGCRQSTKMSTKDRQKYANLNKTISKKAQGASNVNKK